MPASNLRAFLESNMVTYDCIPHKTAYTSQEVAQSAHVRGREMAKSVIVKIDGHLAMCVLPAIYQVDLDAIQRLTGALQVELADEDEFVTRFHGCERGAIPPFGNLYGLDVYVDRHLAEDKRIAFPAGSHNEIIRMRYRDFRNLVHPKVVDSFDTPVA